MNTIKVAGIDPGGTTGIITSRLTITETEVYLKQLECQSLTSPADVCVLIKDCKVSSIFMERRVSNPTSKEGLLPYEQIMLGLEALGFHRIPRGLSMETHGIVLVTPGLWKPFIEAQDIDRGHWYTSTQHEKDACNILHYGLRINYLKKRLCYE